MKRLLHRLAHLLRRQRGYTDVWWRGRHILVGRVCATCGERTGVHCDGGMCEPPHAFPIRYHGLRTR